MGQQHFDAILFRALALHRRRILPTLLFVVAAAFDQDQSFMLVEIAGADLFFQAVSRTGKPVDSGVIHRQPKG